MNPCPSPEQLALLLAERLDGPQTDQVTAHVQSCPACQQVLDTLSAAEAPDFGPATKAVEPGTAYQPVPELVRALKQPMATLGHPAPAAADGAPGLSESGEPWPEVAGYEILAELGRGGMGVVYKARQTRLGRVVALKMLLAGADAGPQELARFRLEAEAVARLQHSNIVQIFEVGEEKGCPYLALEYVAGGSLAQKLKGTPLPDREAAQLVETLARAVHQAHLCMVMHRDLKPANVLLTPDGTPKITDFGLAKRLDAATATQSGALLGTPDYMAPEQAEGKGVGPAADVYSLGAILYHLLTGRPPFLAETPLETLVRLRSEEPVSPSVLRPRVARDLVTICLKCLKKSPDRRYSSAAELADDLGRFLTGEPVRARPTPSWERAAKWVKRQPALATLLAVSSAAAVVLMILLGAWWRDAEARARAVQQLDQAQQQLTDRKTQLARLERGVDEKEKEAARLQQIIPQERARARAARVDVRRALYIRDMHLAQAALDTEDISQLVMILEKHRPPPGEDDVRGFEWHYLWRLCHGARLALRGHTGFIGTVRLAPDGKTLASLSPDEGSVRLWDAVTGAELAPPWGRVTGVSGVAYFPDGKSFVTGHQDGTVRLWNASTGRAGPSFKAHAGPVYGLAFASDERRLATGSQDGTAKVWDLATQRAQAVFPGQGVPVWSVELSADGRILATGAQYAAQVWDVATGRGRLPPVRPPGGAELRLALSPDGKILATAEAYPFDLARTGFVRLWDTAAGKELPALPVPHGGPWGLAFTPDGKTLAVGGNNGAVKFWDLATRKVRHTFFGNAQRVHSIAFTADGKAMATGGNDQIVRLWDAVTPDAPVILHEATGGGAYVAFGPPQDKTLAMLDHRGALRLRDTYTGRERVIFTGRVGRVSSLVFAPDGKTLAAGSWDRTVRLWDVATGKERAAFRGHRADILCVAISPDGQTLAWASRGGGIRLWDLATGKEKLRLQKPKTRPFVSCLAFSPDRTTLATTVGNQAVLLWDLAARRPWAALRQSGVATHSMAFSPDGNLLAAGDWNGTVTLWDLTRVKKRLPVVGAATVALGAPPPGTGPLSAAAALLGGAMEKELITFRPHGYRSAVFAVLFTPDGKTVVSGHIGGAVQFWDVAMLQERFTLRCAPANMPVSLALTSDGKVLAAGGGNGEVYLWDARKPNGRDWAFVPNSHSPQQELVRHQRQAEEAEKAGQWLAAAWHLDRLIRREPRSTMLLARRARALMELGQSERALTDLNVLLRQTPKDADLWFTRGRAHAQRGHWREALADYIQGLEWAPRDGAAWVSRSVAHARLGETEKAAQAYHQAVTRAGVIRLKSEVSWFQRDRGPVRSDLARWQAVAADLAKMPAAGKDDWYIWRARGLAAAALGQWPGAAADLARAAEEKPDNFESWYARARASVELGQWPDAAPACARAVKLRPQDGSAWYLKAVVEQNRGALDKATASYSKAIENGADGWAAWSNRGMTYAEMGQWGNASRDSARAARSPGAFVSAGHLHALVRLQVGDKEGYRKACAILAKRLNNAGDPAMATWVADVCVLTPDAQVDLTLIVRWLERGASQDPNEYSYVHHLGQALYRTGRLKAAVRELTKALRLRALDQWKVEDWLFLAMAHKRLGHGAEARKWLAKATAWLDGEVRERPRWAVPLSWSVRLKLLTLEREAEDLLKKHQS